MKLSSRTYIDNQIKWSQKVKDAEVLAIREAVKEVKDTYADYRAQQNEWRGQAKDQAGTYVTRRELWAGVIAIITIMISILLYLK